jgi:hypothetical protein
MLKAFGLPEPQCAKSVRAEYMRKRTFVLNQFYLAILNIFSLSTNGPHMEGIHAFAYTGVVCHSRIRLHWSSLLFLRVGLSSENLTQLNHSTSLI